MQYSLARSALFIQVVVCISVIGLSFSSELTNSFSNIFANVFSQSEPAHNFVSVLSQPLTLVFVIPFAGYIFLRSEIDKIESSQIKKILCYGVVILLVSSAVITPYSFSPYAFASTDSTNSTVTNSTQHVSSVNGTSSPTQEQDEAIPTGETTTSLSNSTYSTNSTVTYTNQTVSSVNGTTSPTQEPDVISPSGETTTSLSNSTYSTNSTSTDSTNSTSAIEEPILDTIASTQIFAQKGPDFIPGRYIVVLKDVDEAGAVVNEMTSKHGLSVIHVYKYALKGFNAIIPEATLDKVKNDPRVDYVEQDQKVFAFDKPPHSHPTGDDSEQPPSTQELPTGIDRIDADLSSTVAGDGTGTVDVDIAIIDTGIDPKHPDLNVVNHAHCTGTGANKDQNGHGTHVAGTAAALDNEEGVVGVAPGARLWGVKVLDATGSGTLGCVISGIDYVTSHADEIEVANISLGFEGSSSALDTAIANSVAAGVVYVVAAGNSAKDAATFSPANHPDVITVSAIADFNGVGGGNAEPTCRDDVDDTFADFSNFGSLIEIAAPGVCILSTWLGGGYNTISGTSMASPHVAGVAALYVANNPGYSPAQIRDALIAAGTPQTDPDGFTGDPDTSPEPLLDASGLGTLDSSTTTESVNATYTEPVNATSTDSTNSTSTDSTNSTVTDSTNSTSTDTTLDLNATYISEMAISAWVKPDYSSGSPEFTVVSKGESFVLSINNNIPPEKVAKFSVFDGTQWTTVQSSSTIPEEWTHLTASFNKTAIEIYINGVLEGSSLLEGVFQVSSNGQIELKTVDEITSFNDVIIGASITSDSESTPYNIFSGLIEGVQFYDIEQNPIEISQIYKFALNLQQLPVESATISDNTVDEFTLQHDPIVIGEAVTWTEQVSLTNYAETVTIELSDDAILTLVEISDYITTTTLFDETSTVSTDAVIITSSYDDVPPNSSLVSLDLASGQVQTDMPTKLLVINEATYNVLIEFETSAPYTIEKENYGDSTYTKTVTVAHNSALHYTDVTSYSDIPEELVAHGLEFDLFWNIDGVKTNVTDDPLFQVEFVDTDGNGIADQMWWVVPQLSEQEFEIVANIIIINVQSYPSVGREWTVHFDTTGTADLTITGIDGTTFGSDAPDDLEFLELNNGTHTLTPIVQGNSIIYQNYSSGVEGFEKSRVITTGQHNLEFRFGNSVSHAHNDASNIAPDANDDSVTTTINVPLLNIDVLANDFDANSDTLTITSVTTPSKGTAIINPTNTGITYTPNSGVDGIDTFVYTINDGLGGTDTAIVTVTIENTPPLANILAPNNVVEQTIVSLDGSFSFDPDGQQITFRWTQFAGPQVSLTGATTSNAILTAPTVTTLQVLQFNLKVTDTLGAIDNEIVSVTVSPAYDLSDITVDEFTLEHDSIIIGESVTWTEQISLTEDTETLAIELPDDADVTLIEITDDEFTTNTYDETEIQYTDEIIEVSSYDDISTNSSLASLDLVPELVQEEEPTKVLVINETTSDVLIQFETSAPYTVEKVNYDDTIYNKTVTVASDSTLHYTNVTAYSDIPEELVEQGIKFSLFWNIDGVKTDVTYDPRFQVEFVDTDGNGIEDQIWWVVPQLSEQEFEIVAKITIINVQSYPIIGGEWVVRFTTEGTADLTITGVNGTTFGDALPADLTFLELNNGTQTLTPVIEGDSITYPSYSSDQEGFERSLVLTGGEHHLKFQFGNDVVYAHNFAGEIADSAISTVEFDPNFGDRPVITHVSGGIFAIVYEGSSSNIVATVNITSAGIIDSNVIDSLPFSSSTGSSPDIIHVAGDIFAIVYFESGSGGKVATVTINSTGSISNTLLNSLAFDSGVGDHPDIVHVSGDIFAIAYQGSDNDGFVKTIDINSTGSISLTGATNDIFEFADNSNHPRPEIIHVSGDTFAIVHETPIGSNVTTVNITSTGSIVQNTIESLRFTSDNAAHPRIIHVAGDIFAIVYHDSSNSTNFVITAGINSTGGITNIIGSINFVVSSTDIPDIIHVDGDIFAIVYQNFTGIDGLVSTVDIDPTGSIATDLLDSLAFNTNFGAHPTITQVSGDIFAIAYQGPASDGFVTTVDIESESTAVLVPGPEITSIVASDPGGLTPNEFGNGDTITVTFSNNTNRPSVSTKTDIDDLFTFTQNSGPASLGADYVGTWSSPSVLVITIIDSTEATPPIVNQFTITVRSDVVQLKNEAETSLASTATSPPLTGNFGSKAAPFITSIKAADSPVTPAPGFSNGDTITVRFSEATNGQTIPVTTTQDLNSLFDFSQSLGTSYTGVFVNPLTLVITIQNAGGAEVTEDSIGVFTITVKASGNLRDEANSSAASTSKSPPLSGTFGKKEGPSITSLVADDPDGADSFFSAGDTITVTFSEDTNALNSDGTANIPVATKTDLTNLFTFPSSLDPALTGADFTGFFADNATLVITITNAGTANPQLGVFTITVRSDVVQLKNEAETSLASTATSPPLTGNFGNKVGPDITSIEAADPGGLTPGEFGNGDTITVTFSEDTNRPSVSTKTDVDNLFSFTENSAPVSLGDNYVGTWLSPSILVITIIAEGSANPQIGVFKIGVIGELKNKAGTSLDSTAESPALTGDFGLKPGPTITSIKAADPAPIDDAIFGNGDTITVRFSEATNTPPVANKEQIDDLFFFSQNIGDAYSGNFVNPLTLVITIDDAENLESPPQLGVLTITVKTSGNLRDADGNSEPSTSVSPPLTGTFGNKAGPSITSLVALDPFGRTTTFGDDDAIIVTFSEPTNEPPVATKADLDNLFTFSQNIGANYTGSFTDPQTLQITIVDSTGGSPVVGTFRAKVNLAANLKDDSGTSLASVAESPPLSGTFDTKEGPAILSIAAADSDGIDDGSFNAGDTITVKFSEATNRPTVSTKADLDGLFTFSQDLGADYTGIFIDPETLIITIISSAGNGSPTVGTFTITVKADGTNDLKSGTGTSLASVSVSPPLSGSFGNKAGPSIQAIIADDPDNSDNVFGNFDTITIKFLEPTNTPDPTPLVPGLSKAELDDLFFFSQSIGDNYNGTFTLNSTLVINITDTANLEVPPAVDELRITVKASGNLLDFDETSLPSTSVSPLLAGSFGTFIKIIQISDGGTAFTTLPSGITSQITLPAGQSGTITVQRTDINATVSDTGIVVDFLGNVMEITPSDGADCEVDPFCQIAFTFSQEDAIAAGTTPPLVKIFHDADNSGNFTSDEILDGQEGRQDTTFAVIILDLLFEASAIIDDNSKFAVGGVKALALGALFSGGIGGLGNDPHFGETSFTGESTGGGGFGGIIAEFDLSDPTKHTQLHPTDRGIMRQDLYENQGINNIQHVTLYFGLTGSSPEQLQTSKTYIVFDKDQSVHISDPSGSFGKVKFNILERDAYNFVLKYDIEFVNLMPRTDMFLNMWDGDRNPAKKHFKNVFAVTATEPRVPEWVKNNAGWWSDGQISETEFIQAIQFLSKQGIINIPPGPIDETGKTAQSVPNWIKNVAEMWSDDLITEDNFVAAIQWLSTNGIIVI